MASEPALGSFIYATLLSHDRLEDAICHRLAQRLDHSEVDAVLINQTFQSVLEKRPELGGIFRADLAAVFDRDPACNRYIDPLLYFKGFHALATHRFAHALWHEGGATSHCFCRASPRALSPSTSIPPRASARAS